MFIQGVKKTLVPLIVVLKAVSLGHPVYCVIYVVLRYFINSLMYVVYCKGFIDVKCCVSSVRCI